MDLGNRYYRLLRCARLSPALPAGETPAPERESRPPGIESWASFEARYAPLSYPTEGGEVLEATVNLKGTNLETVDTAKGSLQPGIEQVVRSVRNSTKL
jgi:hypothetical protein